MRCSHKESPGQILDSPNELEPIPTIYKNRQLKKTE